MVRSGAVRFSALSHSTTETGDEMITIEIPAWAFWLLLSLFVLNIVLNQMLWSITRKLRNVQSEHTAITDGLVQQIVKFLERIAAKAETPQ